MSASEQSSHVYGDIFARSVYTPADEPRGALRCISQGVAVGALLSFVSAVSSMLMQPGNGYNLFFMAFLPLYLGGGMLFGAFQGIVIWACTHIDGHRLNVLVRVCLSLGILGAFMAAYSYLYETRSPYYGEVSYLNCLAGFGIYMAYGLVFGVVTGSRFQPGYELVRGMTSSPRRSVLTGITGLVLRLVVVFALMESILNFIYEQQRGVERPRFTIAAIAVIHFVAAIVVVLARMPFWILVQLALLINFPIVVFITEVVTANDIALRQLSIVYLALWAAFVLSRMGLPDALLAHIKSQIRYRLGARS
jgi:hypothetical protein